MNLGGNMDVEIKLLGVAYNELGTQWNYPNIFSAYSRLYYMYAGEAYVIIRGDRIEMKPGYLYFLPPHSLLSLHCDNWHAQYNLAFTATSSVGIDRFSGKEFAYEIPAKPEELDIFKRILELNPNFHLNTSSPYGTPQHFFKRQESDPLKQFETDALMKLLVSRILRHEQAISPEISRRTNKINRIVTYVMDHLEEELEVKSLATRFDWTPNYLSALFKQFSGLNLNTYITLRRLEKSQRLLETTGMGLKEISMECGFKTPQYFCRAFKKYLNTTPSKYRKGD